MKPGSWRYPRTTLRLLALVIPWGPACPGAQAQTQAGEVRPPAVAGHFYPAEAGALRERMEDLLAAEPIPEYGAGQVIRAGIVPHAGLDYSGPVAARFYRALRGRSYDAVVVVAVSHQEAFTGVSIWPGTHLSTPLGEIPVERALAERLVAADDSIRFGTAGHGAEHSLEVQLPFLQSVLPGVPVVPLVVGRQSFDLSYRLAATLASVLAGRDVLLLASSDLSHFHADTTASRLDGDLLDLVRSGDTFLLGYRGFTGELEACGLGGVVAVMEAARRLGAGRAEVLAYANSGGVTGDMSSVVGYGAVAFSEGEGGGDPLGSQERETLLAIARASVEAAVRGDSAPPVPEVPPVLARKQAAFVTLRADGELRGCVGAIFAVRGLAEQVRESALAASGDRRFPRLRPEELTRLEYEITLLSPLVPLQDPETVVVGRDGLMLVQGDDHGVLLPSVPVEHGWDRERFLEEIGVKAGLGRRAWRQPGTQLFSFSGETVR